jgi:multidrug efflux pump subunit AcrA (membrane-fusion protein)
VRHHRVFSLAECAALGRIIPSSPAFAITGSVALLVALITGGIAWAALTSAELVVRAPARIRARSAPQLPFAASSGERVVAPTGGRIRAVAVREGQRVAAGAPLAELDMQATANDLARLESALAVARSARDATRRMQDLATAQFAAAQDTRKAELSQAQDEESRGQRRRASDIALARTTLEAARKDQARVLALESDGAAPRAQAEQAASKVGEARARLEAAMVGAATGRAMVLQRQLAQAERDFAVHGEDLAQQLARDDGELAAAERRVDNARLELAKARVVADRAGVVSTVSVTAGELVQPGQAMFVISPETGLRVDAAVAAADVGRLKLGMPARIRFDAFDWQRYGTATGTIRQISPDAEPLSTGSGQLLVYTVRVELDRESIGSGDHAGQLKLGMTGTVEVITGDDHLLTLLLGRLHQAISLGP